MRERSLDIARRVVADRDGADELLLIANLFNEDRAFPFAQNSSQADPAAYKSGSGRRTLGKRQLPVSPGRAWETSRVIVRGASTGGSAGISRENSRPGGTSPTYFCTTLSISSGGKSPLTAEDQIVRLIRQPVIRVNIIAAQPLNDRLIPDHRHARRADVIAIHLRQLFKLTRSGSPLSISSSRCTTCTRADIPRA